MPSKVSSDSAGIAVSDVTIQAQLNSSDGLDKTTASKYASYLWEMYKYIKENPAVKAALDGHEVYEGTTKVIRAAGYTGDMNTLIRQSSALRSYSAGGGASVLGVFVDRFAGLAKSQGIELNECALSISKIALDIGGTGALVLTAWGVLVAGAGVVSTFQDSQSMAKACSWE